MEDALIINATMNFAMLHSQFNILCIFPVYLYGFFKIVKQKSSHFKVDHVFLYCNGMADAENMHIFNKKE